MFLHNDKELFQEVIVSAAEDLGLVVPIVEKDYYVTMILKNFPYGARSVCLKAVHHYQNATM